MSELLSVVIPVYNEERVLARTVTTVISFLNRQRAFEYEIVIANNGSTDRTRLIATELASQQQGIRVLHLDQRGRGRAVKAAWRQTSATGV